MFFYEKEKDFAEYPAECPIHGLILAVIPGIQSLVRCIPQ